MNHRDRVFMTISVEPQLDSLIIAPCEAGQRIDKLLTDRYPTFSRTYFQKLIEEGFVLLNDKPIKKRFAPEVGDEIEVCFQLTPEISLEPESIPLDILFEDEHLIAVNKPSGMVVHPAPGHWNGTFVNALLAHCQNLASNGDPLRPGIVHRLDKDTSGILLAAKTAQAHQKLVQMFATRQMEKTYLAICIGRPPNTTIAASIGRHPTQRKEMAVVEQRGKEAISQIQVLAFNHQLSLVLIRPHTGRTHQIRVHLKYIGHPVLGDATYGCSKVNESLQVERQLLHAYRLNFMHPITNAPISLIATLPEDIKKWIEQFCDTPINFFE
jgi:23S rRNA pseudouridine1911/1915/1917 synthase